MFNIYSQQNTQFLWSLLLSIILAVFSSSLPAVANPNKPRACSLDDHLEVSEDGVVYGFGDFDFRQRVYDFDIFSLGALDPTLQSSLYLPNRACLRYEIVNTGSEKIEEFRINGVDFGWIDLLPNDPIRKLSFVYTKYDRIEVAPVTVRAFKNSTEQTRIVSTVEAIEKNIQSGGEAANFQFFSVAHRLPDVLPAFQEANIEPSVVPAFGYSQKRRLYPALVEEFRSKLASMRVLSSAYFGSGQMELFTTIDLTLGRAGEATVFAPVQRALEEYISAKDFNLPLGRGVERFLTYLMEYRNVPIVASSGWVYPAKLGFSAKPDSQLFVVRQPITVSIGEWNACINATTYSPVPVSAAPEYCQEYPVDK